MHEETDDPDGDGLIGIFNEWSVYGTDPFLADTDSDGERDTTDVAPANPAVHDAAEVWTVGSSTDFEVSAGGFATDRTLWERGAPSTGPGYAASGSTVWATSTDGNYFAEAEEALYFPAMDLAGSTSPMLGFRLWHRVWGTGDGTTLQIYDRGRWVPLPVTQPLQTGTLASGETAWTDAGDDVRYDLVLASLAPWSGQTVWVRLWFESNGNNQDAAGAFIDDAVLSDETLDADGDGLVGVLDELLTYGTDPFLFDTDGDGVDDGEELAQGTDPLNPAVFPGSTPISVGDVLDFEANDGGARTRGSLWGWAITGRAVSGDRA